MFDWFQAFSFAVLSKESSTASSTLLTKAPAALTNNNPYQLTLGGSGGGLATFQAQVGLQRE